MRFHLFLLALLFSLPACKTVQTTDGTKLRVRSPKFLLKKMDAQRHEVEWLTAKARLKFDHNGNTEKASANIRLRRDSAIWMNIKKFGIEGARILIRPDSVFVINRLDKNYVASDFSFIESQYNLPADFSTIQDLILGNAFFVTQENVESAIKDEAYFLLAENDLPMANVYWLDGRDFLLEKMVFQDVRHNRQVTVEQWNYAPAGHLTAFATERKVSLSSPQTGDVVIDFDLSKVKVDEPAGMRFSIPAGYERVGED